MGNRVFASKSYICCGKAQFRRLFLIFCRIKGKERLNLKGRGSRRGVWKLTLLILQPLEHEPDQNFLLCYWGLLGSQIVAQDLPFLQML